MSTPPSDGPSPAELRRQARTYAALVSAFGRTETLLADLAACADPEEASLLLQRQLDIDEESADLVLSLQLRQFPRSQQDRLRVEAERRAREAGVEPPGA